MSLCDPLPSPKEEPPWVLREGLAQTFLLSTALSPKDGVEAWLHEIRSTDVPPEEKSGEFVDLSIEEYLASPAKHLSRLWIRFREFH